MRRKLIRQGKNALTMTLPASWIEKKNLKAGDEIEIDEKEGSLMLGGLSKNTKTISLYFENAERQLIRTILASYYRKGYYEIEVKFKGYAPFELLQEVVSSLMGYEIISLTKNSCIIRDVMGTENLSSINTINKIFQNINLLYELIIEQFTKTKPIDLAQIKKNIIKLRDYCQRVISIENKEEAFELYAFVLALEKIAGELYSLSREEFIKPLAKEDMDFLDFHYSLLTRIYNIFLKSDFSGARVIYSEILKNIHEDNKKDIYANKMIDKKQNKKIVMCCNRLLHFEFILASRLQGIIKTY